jgi:hypothetical protein
VKYYNSIEHTNTGFPTCTSNDYIEQLVSPHKSLPRVYTNSSSTAAAHSGLYYDRKAQLKKKRL